MKKLIAVILFTLMSSHSFAHGGEDPVQELQKNRSRMTGEQQSFEQLSAQRERLNNLQTQTDYLQKRVLLMRNLLAGDYPHIKKKMSKYSLDYMKVLDGSLKEFQETLVQMKSTLSD